MNYQSADKPTLYFIGVTTAQSSIMRVFPEWAKFLDLGDVAIKGVDFPIHASADAYREAVSFIKSDPMSKGALVTTHKLDLYDACKDQFDLIDTHAKLMTEVSCISKKEQLLACNAKDPISSGLAIDGFLPDDFFANNDGALFCIGAGGSTLAITWHLQQMSRKANRPARMVVSDKSQTRLEHIQRYHQEAGVDIPVEYVLVQNLGDNANVLSSLPSHSFVINASGVGKDTPGSPISNAALFPENSVVWDLNYRGELLFLNQAREQQKARSLQVKDGWTYFLHGWTQVIAEVFHVDIPTSGVDFDRLGEIALEVGKPETR